MNVGLSFGATVALFAYLGYWLDGRYGWAPWGTVVCVMAGVALATYHLLKETA
ncbi:MAG: AtpZ/AtpI family protein [Planctomycetes bacterium]|nr:AtpZ/AtpI family protein [Planctomycetota bacterium]